jgi:regulator of sigma E protease
LLSPVLLALWVRWIPLALAGALHTTAHFVTGRAVGIPVRLQFGFGPAVWRFHAFDVGVLPGAMGRPDLEGRPMGAVLGYLVSGPLGSIVSAWAIAFVLFSLSAWMQPASAPLVGLVEAGSAAEQAGFRAGDRIVSVDGRATRTWNEAVLAVAEGGRVALQRAGRPIEIEVSAIGTGSGLIASRPASVIAVQPGGAFEASGLRDRDRIVAIDGRGIDSWAEVEAAIARPIGKVRILRDGFEFDLPIESGPPGVEFGDRLVGGVFPGGPADAAGIRAGDRILSVDGVPVRDFTELGRIIQRSEPPVTIALERDGAEHEVQVIAASIRVDGQSIRRVGLERTEGLYLDPEVIREGDTVIGGILWGASSANRVMGSQLALLGELAVGRPRMLEGPVVVVRESAGNLLGLLAVLATASGLIVALYNLLPLPGSDLLTGLDQMARRWWGRPLPLRAWSWVAGSALVLLALLVLLIDLSRFL